jgi:hypothetical protein
MPRASSGIVDNSSPVVPGVARTRIPSTVGLTTELIANALEGAGANGDAEISGSVASVEAGGVVLGTAEADVAAGVG